MSRWLQGATKPVQAAPGPALAGEILSMPPALRPGVVWLQTGIGHDVAAEKLADAGITVVQDRCLGVYAARYGERVER